MVKHKQNGDAMAVLTAATESAIEKHQRDPARKARAARLETLEKRRDELAGKIGEIEAKIRADRDTTHERWAERLARGDAAPPAITGEELLPSIREERDATKRAIELLGAEIAEADRLAGEALCEELRGPYRDAIAELAARFAGLVDGNDTIRRTIGILRAAGVHDGALIDSSVLVALSPARDPQGEWQGWRRHVRARGFLEE